MGKLDCDGMNPFSPHLEATIAPVLMASSAENTQQELQPCHSENPGA